jgi:hypothetical protein
VRARAGRSLADPDKAVRHHTASVSNDRAVQDKWQARWAELEPFRANDSADDPRERR